MSESKSTVNYLFGDSDRAAQRLELLAHIFHDSTRALLLKAASGNAWRLAVDLGCGPGFTTALIAQTLQCDRVVGLDTSESFLKLARAAMPGGPSFAAHDITKVPFPCGEAEVIFCRYLLTHLHDPEAIVERWATQLGAGGLLIIEEVETIRTAHPVFACYLQIVEALLASQSNRLYAGALVGALGSSGSLKPLLNEVRMVPVRNCDAAGMFVLNLDAWKDSAFVRANYPHKAILELETALIRIAEKETPASEITWEMRQGSFSRK